nr:hypothetical protein [Angustibacter aerolatus]
MSAVEPRAAQIERLLEALGERLRAPGVAASVYVVGGAAIPVTVRDGRRTVDVDAVVSDHVVREEARALAEQRARPPSLAQRERQGVGAATICCGRAAAERSRPHRAPGAGGAPPGDEGSSRSDPRTHRTSSRWRNASSLGEDPASYQQPPATRVPGRRRPTDPARGAVRRRGRRGAAPWRDRGAPAAAGAATSHTLKRNSTTSPSAMT